MTNICDILRPLSVITVFPSVTVSGTHDLLRLFLNKFIFAFVRIHYDIHSGKYQRAITSFFARHVLIKTKGKI